MQIYDFFSRKPYICICFTNIGEYIMKYFATVFFFCVFALSAKAQLIFTSDEFFAAFSSGPASGTSYSSSDLNGLAAIIAQSGTGMSWDLGNRVYTQDAVSTATQTLLTYPGDAALADDPDFLGSTHVLKTVSSDPTEPIVYMFIKFDQTGYWWLGFSQDSMGIKKKIFGYAPPQQQMKFPLTYQTAWQSNSVVHSPELPELASYSMGVNAIADGSGTLITPTSAHHKGDAGPMSSTEAIRVKTRNTTTYAYTIPGVGTYTTTSVTHTFQWYTKDGHSATIEADTNVVPQGVSYSMQSGSNSVRDNYSSPESILNLYLSANPLSHTEAKLSFIMKNDGNAQVSIMDQLGREVHMLQNGRLEAGQHSLPIDPTMFSSGTYFIRVNAEGMTATRKLIITK